MYIEILLFYYGVIQFIKNVDVNADPLIASDENAKSEHPFQILLPFSSRNVQVSS